MFLQNGKNCGNSVSSTKIPFSDNFYSVDTFNRTRAFKQMIKFMAQNNAPDWYLHKITVIKRKVCNNSSLCRLIPSIKGYVMFKKVKRRCAFHSPCSFCWCWPLWLDPFWSLLGLKSAVCGVHFNVLTMTIQREASRIWCKRLIWAGLPFSTHRSSTRHTKIMSHFLSGS